MKLLEHLLRAQNVLRICISMKKLQFWQTTSVDVGPLWRVVRKKNEIKNHRSKGYFTRRLP